MKRITYKCKHCGSHDVRRDADAVWNEITQEWELVSVYDNATCEDCGGETSLEEEGIDHEN
jgi:DNA-directed RNA polymerase subunit RPC12/RpoP